MTGGQHSEILCKNDWGEKKVLQINVFLVIDFILISPCKIMLPDNRETEIA